MRESKIIMKSACKGFDISLKKKKHFQENSNQAWDKSTIYTSGLSLNW